MFSSSTIDIVTVVLGFLIGVYLPLGLWNLAAFARKVYRPVSVKGGFFAKAIEIARRLLRLIWRVSLHLLFVATGLFVLFLILGLFVERAGLQHDERNNLLLGLGIFAGLFGGIAFFIFGLIRGRMKARAAKKSTGRQEAAETPD